MALLAVHLSGVPRTAGSDQAEVWQVSLALLALCTHHLHCLSVQLTWFTGLPVRCCRRGFSLC